MLRYVFLFAKKIAIHTCGELLYCVRMLRSFSKSTSQHLFFLAVLFIVAALFFTMIKSYTIILLTAFMVAILVAPLDRSLSKKIKYRSLSSGIVVFCVFVFVFLPMLALLVLGIEQTSTAINSLQTSGWFEQNQMNTLPFFQNLPNIVQQNLINVDLNQFAQTFNTWIFRNLVTTFSNAPRLFLEIFVFFFALFYLLVDRKKITQFLIRLSPLKDDTDVHMAHRIVNTVRSIVYGILIYSFISGTIAVAGMALFGIPISFSLIVVSYLSALVPIVATSLVLVPATLYLFSVGMTIPAIALGLWTFVSIGIIGNILSPYLIRGTTHINTFLILIGILGGIELFGPIGVIVGPTIVGTLIGLLELYRPDILGEQMNKNKKTSHAKRR